MQCIVEDLFAEGEWAILEWRDPSGLRGCGFFHVVDGRIVLHAATGTSCRSVGSGVRDPRRPGTVRRLALLALISAAAPTGAQPAAGSAAWAPNDIRVTQTETGRPGNVTTHFEVAANGDARIAVELRNDGTHTAGTILLIGGRWMLTQGFTAKAGKDIEALDAAALNSQLVIVLLTAALPGGRPAPGPAQHVRFAEKTSAIRIATASTSAEYHAPWTVTGSVTVPEADAPASYELSFTYSDEGAARTIDFAGSVANDKSPLDLPDSMKLAGWKVRRLGTTPESSPTATPSGAGAHHAPPKVATLGELRERP